MNIIEKTARHFLLVSKHRWIVFKLAVKAGIPYRGLVHDLSKFSPTEFYESIKYYNGDKSPLHLCRDDIGYSKAWLHHKGRNKHHFEYWEDMSKQHGRYGVFPPYKYIVEAVCDKISAGMTYQKDKWTQKEPYNYWTNIESKAPVEKHPGTLEFMDIVLKKIADEGVDAGLNRKFLKGTYQRIKEKYNIK